MTISQIAASMKQAIATNLDIDGLETGFTQRSSKLTASGFVQSIVMGWLNNPEATLVELAQACGLRGIFISPQGLDNRFSEASVKLLQRVFERAIQRVIESDLVSSPILSRFSGVWLLDSTFISLPPELAEQWPGLGNNKGENTAGMKLHLSFNFLNGQIETLEVTAGKAQDRSSIIHQACLPAKGLRLADLGYFDLKVLAEHHDANAYFLSRYRMKTALFSLDGNRLHLLRLLQTRDHLDLHVLVGLQTQLNCRLLAHRVPDSVAEQRRRRIREKARVQGKTASKLTLALADWTILLTNTNQSQLTLKEAFVLIRIRWQIELIFKLWKSHNHLGQSRSANPWRILTELFAKMTALLFQQWLLIVACWHLPDRSLEKATRLIRNTALSLLMVLDDLSQLQALIQLITQAIPHTSRLYKRRGNPNSFQLLFQASEGLA
ncbi:MAG: IS4 family transposase [Chloroflexota bacterium]